ncbi:MAG TPA: NUDIX domain-containing protein [Candidatus Paceibacterota bacterium]
MPEYIDVLNKDGSPAKIKKLKSEIHKTGDWHRTVHVWILNSKKELLIQLRSPNKENFPNLWDISAAGHISAGEDSQTGAIREMKEELGLDIRAEDLVFLKEVITEDVLNLKSGPYFDNEFHDVYLVTKDIDIKSLTLQKEEVAEVCWIPYLELEKDLKTHPENYIDQGEEYDVLFAYIKSLK